jgi:hypothetical protein
MPGKNKAVKVVSGAAYFRFYFLLRAWRKPLICVQAQYPVTGRLLKGKLLLQHMAGPWPLHNIPGIVSADINRLVSAQ